MGLKCTLCCKNCFVLFVWFFFSYSRLFSTSSQQLELFSISLVRFELLGVDCKILNQGVANHNKYRVIPGWTEWADFEVSKFLLGAEAVGIKKTNKLLINP